MTAEQLEELLGKVTQGDWRVDHFSTTSVVAGEKRRSICSTGGYSANRNSERINDENLANAALIAIAPSLARRVIAAEKLVEALEELPLGDGPLAQLVTAYRGASK